MAGGGVNGIALASIGAGAVFAYAGVKGYSIPQTIQSIIQGKTPAGQTQAIPITATTTAAAAAGNAASSNPGLPSGGGSNAENQRLGELMAGSYGWAPSQNSAEWNALNWIVEDESGWSDTITNPTSTAAGIAQNINGFGPGYERGNAPQQIAWLLAYIKSRYGDPISAKNFHLANGYY